MDAINKSDVPPVLRRYYADSGATCTLDAYIQRHYQLYREGLLEDAPFLSLSDWMRSFLPESHRKQPPENVEAQRGQSA
jgi:hypothetical protein